MAVTDAQRQPDRARIAEIMRMVRDASTEPTQRNRLIDEGIGIIERIRMEGPTVEERAHLHAASVRTFEKMIEHYGQPEATRLWMRDDTLDAFAVGRLTVRGRDN